MSEETIICVGYSRLPEGMAAKNLYGAMGVGFEINRDTGIIVNTTATFVTEMCTSFMSSIFNGENINCGLEKPISVFEDRYYGMGKKAIVAAVIDAYNQYANFKQEKLRLVD